jgi:predicted Zn-dependent protease
MALAHTAAQEGDTERAIRILEGYRKLRPNDVEIQNRLARAYRQGGKRGKALIALQRSVAIDGEQFETLLELAATLLEAGATKKALSEAERAIELVPEESAAHLMKARILMQMKHLREAALALQRAERVSPGEERVAQLTLELERLKKKRP